MIDINASHKKLLEEVSRPDFVPDFLQKMPACVIPAPERTEYNTPYEKMWIEADRFFNDPYYIYQENEILLELNESISIFPELYFGLSILFLILYGILVSSDKTKNYPLLQSSFIKLSILCLGFTAILTENCRHLAHKSVFFNNTLILDDLCVYSKIFLLVISGLYFIFLLQYTNNEKLNSCEYIILILFALLGILFICTSNDLITAYLAIEVQSLSFYLLAAYNKNSIFSTESGLKYFVLGSFSSSLFLFGSSLVYGITGSTNINDFKDLFVNNYHEHFIISTTNPLTELNLLQFGLLFILISLFFKLSLAPFHVWSPDIYEGSATSTTFFFAVIAKLGVFILLIRFFYYGFFSLLDNWRYYIVGVALFSVVIGSFGGLEQRKIKSLLAYSSISHMGYSLLAFSTFTFQGIQVLISYLLVYMLSGLCLWGILLSLKMKNTSYINKGNKDLADFTQLGKSNNILAFFFSTVLLSIAGFPPLIGFFAKLNVFLSVMETTLYFIAIVGILCSVIATFYYIRIIKIVYFEKSLTGNLYIPINYPNSLITGTCFYLFLYLFFNPNILHLICYKMAYIGYPI